MIALAPRLALCTVLAAGAAAAQPPTMGMGGMNGPPMQATVHVDSNAVIDQSHACVDGKPAGGPAPKVVRTMPAPGSVVRPGAMVLSVTFDRPMACKANLAESRFPVPCPGGGGAVVISLDKRTLTTVCQVEAGASYSMPLVDFPGADGTSSERYDLAFTTSTQTPATDARQAIAFERTGSVGR
jgi:hypothetical protein